MFSRTSSTVTDADFDALLVWMTIRWVIRSRMTIPSDGKASDKRAGVMEYYKRVFKKRYGIPGCDHAVFLSNVEQNALLPQLLTALNILTSIAAIVWVNRSFACI